MAKLTPIINCPIIIEGRRPKRSAIKPDIKPKAAILQKRKHVPISTAEGYKFVGIKFHASVPTRMKIIHGIVYEMKSLYSVLGRDSLQTPYSMLNSFVNRVT